MKNISSLIAALSLIFTADTAHAQVISKGSHHLNLGYGLASNFKRDRAGTIVGPILAGYRYALGNRITLGAEFGYAHGNTGVTAFKRYSPVLGKVTVADRLQYDIYTATVRADYHYINRKRLDIYSGLMLEGYMWYGRYDVDKTYNHDYWVVGAGLCVAGCRYMIHPKVGVYGEFSIREVGYGVIGVSARLGKL